MKSYSMAVVAVGLYTSTDPSKIVKDINDKQTVTLKPLSGKMPNNMRLLNGTVAENSGLIPGNSYIVQFDEQEAKDSEVIAERIKEYGRQFTVTVIQKLDVLTLLDVKAKLGEPEVEMIVEGRKAEPEEVINRRAALREESEKRRKELDAKFGLKPVREANL